MVHGHRKPKQRASFSTLVYHVLRVQVKRWYLHTKHPRGQEESPLTEQHDDGPLWSWIWTERDCNITQKKNSRCRRARRCDTLYKAWLIYHLRVGNKANCTVKRVNVYLQRKPAHMPFHPQSLPGRRGQVLDKNQHVTTGQYQMRKINTCSWDR